MNEYLFERCYYNGMNPTILLHQYYYFIIKLICEKKVEK